MKSIEMDMTQGSLFKKIFIFSVPLVITNVLQILFNMTDTAVVGRFAGYLPLGSVGSTGQMVFFCSGVFYKDKPFAEVLVKSFKQLIVPYFFFLVVWNWVNMAVNLRWSKKL